jgi:hypothetical protein
MSSITILPRLPMIQQLLCYRCNITQLPRLDHCSMLDCRDNEVTIPDLPLIRTLYYSTKKPNTVRVQLV